MLKHIILSLFAIFFLIGIGTASATRISKAIIINHSQIGGSTLTNFTVYWGGTFTFLKTVGNGGQVQSSSGYDVMFDTASGCPNVGTGGQTIHWEQENWNGTTGAAQYWVQLASISSSVNTTFYVCYNDNTINSFQGGATGSAWDANYAGIWHLATPNISAPDSTSNGNNGVAAGSVTGQWGTGILNGDAIVRTGNYLTTSKTVGTLTDFSWVGWIKPGVGIVGVPNGVEIVKLDSGNSVLYLTVGANNETNPVPGLTAHKFDVVIRSNSGSVVVAAGSVTVDDGNWHQVAIVRSTGSTNLKIYVDGALDTTTTYSDVATINLPINYSMFATSLSWNDTQYFGQADEIGMWTRALSSTEITQLYNSGTPLAYPHTPGSIDTNILFYYKLDDASGTTAVDATINGYNATWNNIYPSVLPAATGNGVVDGAALYETTNGSLQNCFQISLGGVICNGIDVGNNSNLQITGNISIEAWIKPSTYALPGSEMDIFSKTFRNYAGPYDFAWNDNWNATGFNELTLYRSNGSCHGYPYVVTSPPQGFLPSGVMQYVAITAPGTPPADGIFYVNGVSYDGGTRDWTNPGDADYPCTPADALGDAKIGARNSNAPADNASPVWFGGTIDEVRVSNSIRPANYFTAVYNNLNNPTTFFVQTPGSALF